MMFGLASAAAFVVAIRHFTSGRAAALREPHAAAEASIGPAEKSFHFHLCGNYCGDNWCNGQQMRESECAKAEQLAQPDSCFDGCCMAHDMCCVAGHDQTGCNKEMLGCIVGCRMAAFREGKLEHWFKCGAVLEAAMAAGQHCECGLCPMPGVAVTEALQPGSTDHPDHNLGHSLARPTRPGWVQLG
jgi:hypothetical protein